MSATDKPTVIKKYANRRLYHTGTSTYVTLDDLAGPAPPRCGGRLGAGANSAPQPASPGYHRPTPG